MRHLTHRKRHAGVNLDANIDAAGIRTTNNISSSVVGVGVGAKMNNQNILEENDASTDAEGPHFLKQSKMSFGRDIR